MLTKHVFIVTKSYPDKPTGNHIKNRHRNVIQPKLDMNNGVTTSAELTKSSNPKNIYRTERNGIDRKLDRYRTRDFAYDAGRHYLDVELLL